MCEYLVVVFEYINRAVLDMCNGVLMHQLQNVHCKRIKRELLPFWRIYSFGWICNHDLSYILARGRALAHNFRFMMEMEVFM